MMSEDKDLTVGFIGQGYVGGNMADDFEERGFLVVRYAKEKEYVSNKDQLQDCEVVFTAVPTPTTPEGADISIVESVLPLCPEESTVVIKSTIPPGTTEQLQEAHPDKVVLFSPEFLSVKTAGDEARNPNFNIIGLPVESEKHLEAAELVHEILPEAPHQFTVDAKTAELFKYVHNIHGFTRIILSNLFHDLGEKLGANWDDIMPMIAANPMMSPWYNQPIHKSGRGAGGGCFIKDFASFKDQFEKLLPEDELGIAVLRALEAKNLELLRSTNKDQDLVAEVYPDLPK